MGNERVVVVKEQKRGGFWPFVGGLLIGAVVVKLAGDYVEKNRKSKEPEPQPTPEIKNQDEIRLIENLIDELVLKPIKTDMDYSHLTYLRKKLGELRNG
jgi:hypothetical protein